MMKVLLCTPYVGLSPANPGGIAIWARNIENYYNSLNSDVELEIFPMDRKHESGDLTLIPRLWYGIKEYYPTVNRFRRHIKRHRYDVIHICSSAQIGLVRDLLIVNIARTEHIPVVVHFHFGRMPELFKVRNWEYKLIRTVVKRATKAVVMDRKSLETLTDHNYTNAVNLPNPLSDKILTQIRTIQNGFTIEREKRKLLYAGHVIPTKGVYELIEACAQIPDIKLLVIGEYLEDIKIKLVDLAVAKSGSSNWLEFTGPVKHERVIQEMMNSAIFVLPTYTEGFPNVILECMASGCPIITTPVGAIPDMLQFDSSQACGACVDVKDVQGLKNTIERQLNNYDSALLMAEKAKQRVIDNYSMPSVWKQLVSIWNMACNCS